MIHIIFFLGWSKVCTMFHPNTWIINSTFMFRLQRCKCSLMHTFYEFWCQKRDVIFLTLYEGTPFYLELCFHNIKLVIESTVGFYSQSIYELVICLRLIYLVPKWISSWTTQIFFREENETEIRFLKFSNDRKFFSRLIFLR